MDDEEGESYDLFFVASHFSSTYQWISPSNIFVLFFLICPPIQILEIADICCQGRVVSVLEGGYGRTSRQQPQAAAAASVSDSAAGDSKLPKLDKSVFAECAFQHVQALVDPFDE